MSEIEMGAKNFVGYEYRDVEVKRSMEAVYADGYANFGWALESANTPVGGVNSVAMKFKRDRKIRNKAELGRLQRQFDACATEIEGLERSKAVGPSAAAYMIGLVGTAFMAGSVFAYLGGMLPLCIVLAVPGFAGWVLPYLCYVALQKKKTQQVAPLIDRTYDEVYDVCEKASALLAK